MIYITMVIGSNNGLRMIGTHAYFGTAVLHSLLGSLSDNRRRFWSEMGTFCFKTVFRGA